MKITFWELKNHRFVAQGTARREYQILTVDRDHCQLVRQDGEIVEIVTDNLLDILNH